MGEEGFVWERGEAERVGIGTINLFFSQEIVRFSPQPAEQQLAGTAFLTLFPFVTLFSPPLFFQARARIRIRIRMPLRYTVL